MLYPSGQFSLLPYTHQVSLFCIIPIRSVFSANLYPPGQSFSVFLHPPGQSSLWYTIPARSVFSLTLYLQGQFSLCYPIPTRSVFSVLYYTHQVDFLCITLYPSPWCNCNGWRRKTPSYSIPTLVCLPWLWFIKLWIWPPFEVAWNPLLLPPFTPYMYKCPYPLTKYVCVCSGWGVGGGLGWNNWVILFWLIIFIWCYSLLSGRLCCIHMYLVGYLSVSVIYWTPCALILWYCMCMGDLNL